MTENDESLDMKRAIKTIASASIIASIAAAISGYFVYWQGFYAGADTALCAVSIFQGNDPDEDASCIRAQQPVYMLRSR